LDDIDIIIKSIEGALEKLAAGGMTPPFVFVAASRHGDLFAVRCRQGEDGRLSYEPLAVRSETPGSCLPVTCMVIDRAGRAARLVIRAGGAGEATFH